jgi:hypothetical protein
MRATVSAKRPDGDTAASSRLGFSFASVDHAVGSGASSVKERGSGRLTSAFDPLGERDRDGDT